MKEEWRKKRRINPSSWCKNKEDFFCFQPFFRLFSSTFSCEVRSFLYICLFFFPVHKNYNFKTMWNNFTECIVLWKKIFKSFKSVANNKIKNTSENQKTKWKHCYYSQQPFWFCSYAVTTILRQLLPPSLSPFTPTKLSPLRLPPTSPPSPLKCHAHPHSSTKTQLHKRSVPRTSIWWIT